MRKELLRCLLARNPVPSVRVFRKATKSSSSSTVSQDGHPSPTIGAFECKSRGEDSQAADSIVGGMNSEC